LTAPSKIVAGDTLEFLTEVSAYLPVDGWIFKMRLVPRFTSPTQAPVLLTAVTEGTSYRISVGPSVTELWVAGQYTWISYVEKAGARHVLEGTQYSGELTIEPDPDNLAQGFDGRSQAQKAIADLKIALATYTASNGAVKSYTIAGRSIIFHDSDQIKQQLSFWKTEAFREFRNDQLAKGLADPKTVYLKYG